MLRILISIWMLSVVNNNCLYCLNDVLQRGKMRRLEFTLPHYATHLYCLFVSIIQHSSYNFIDCRRVGAWARGIAIYAASTSHQLALLLLCPFPESEGRAPWGKCTFPPLQISHKMPRNPIVKDWISYFGNCILIQAVHKYHNWAICGTRMPNSKIA